VSSGKCEDGNFGDLKEHHFGCGRRNSIQRLWLLAVFMNEGSMDKGRPSKRLCLKSPVSGCEVMVGL
jgi:hypothetical protein